MVAKRTRKKIAKPEVDEIAPTLSNQSLNDIESSDIPQKRVKIPTKLVYFVIIVVAFLGGAYLTKDWYIAAIVNNRPITRFSLDRELEKQGGKQVLDTKITELLIIDEASKQKINISQTDIDNRVKQIEDQFTSQGSNLDDLLKQRNETRKDLQYQIRLQLIVENILGKDITVTDAEVSAYFESNKGYYPTGTKLEDKKSEIMTTLEQQKLSEKLQTYLEDLKKKASIHYFINF